MRCTTFLVGSAEGRDERDAEEEDEEDEEDEGGEEEEEQEEGEGEVHDPAEEARTFSCDACATMWDGGAHSTLLAGRAFWKRL